MAGGAGLFGQQLSLQDQLFQQQLARAQGAQALENPAMDMARLSMGLGGTSAQAGAGVLQAAE